MNIKFYKSIIIVLLLVFTYFFGFITIKSDIASALSYNGEDLARAILANQSTLVSSSYTDTDTISNRQAVVLSSFGGFTPTNGNTFALFSTGIAGANIVTTDAQNPGDERGTWFKNKNSYPRDSATLTMVLKVPLYMHYLYYDVQFFSAE